MTNTQYRAWLQQMVTNAYNAYQCAPTPMERHWEQGNHEAWKAALKKFDNEVLATDQHMRSMNTGLFRWLERG